MQILDCEYRGNSDMVQITATIKEQVMYGISIEYLHLTLTHSKGQGQVHAYFDSEYLGNGNRYGKNYYCCQTASHVWAFIWHIYI